MHLTRRTFERTFRLAAAAAVAGPCDIMQRCPNCSSYRRKSARIEFPSIESRLLWKLLLPFASASLLLAAAAGCARTNFRFFPASSVKPGTSRLGLPYRRLVTRLISGAVRI